MSRTLVWLVLAALAWTAFGCGDDDGAGNGEGSTRELEHLVTALEDVTNSPTRSSIDKASTAPPSASSAG